MWSRRRLMWAGAMALSTVGVRAAAAERLSLRTAAGRTVEVSVWSAGAGNSARGSILRDAILFSHGARSAPWKYEALIEPWRAAGWDVYAPLHVDSTDHPDTASFAGLASWPARIEDMRALAEHLGPRGCVAAGHSYGGLVALTLGGAAPMPPPGIEGLLRDPRVRCVLAFSPPGPQPPLIGPQAYASLSVPAFIQTGDLDVPPGAPPDAWQQHLAAYDAAPGRGDRYALVLEGVDHYFGGLVGRPELPGPRPVAAFAAAVELSTMFLRAYGYPHGAAGSTAAPLETRLNAAGAVRLMRR